MEEYLEARCEGHVAFARLNRPEKKNALTPEMLESLESHLARWERDPALRVLVIEAAGNAFCAGADIRFLSTLDEAGMRAWELLGNRVLDRLERCTMISIASLNGYALGGGLTLAAACDLRIAASTATFAQPESGLGWIPGWGGVRRLARSIGPQRAKELCLTGERIDAAEARRIGLISRAVEPADLPAATRELAAKIVEAGPAAASIKRLADGPPELAHHYDALVNASLLHSEKGRRMIEGFLKRNTASGQ